MLSVYDLYDLHAILVRIRFSPDDAINYDIMLKVMDVLTNNRDNCDPNQFRLAIQSVNGLRNNNLYDFAYIENKYSYFPLSPLKDEKIYSVLVRACEEMLCVIEKHNKEHIFDLSDCLHNLPLLIAEHHLTIPESYWNNEIKYYRKKWSNNFLVKEQHLLNRVIR